jgi:glycosyltransferase involved in cell wall biosynthesis
MAKVSVIIPAYNGDRFIQKTIDSVLAQTFTDYEIIVIDDGSQDNTSQVLESYGKNIQYIYQHNQGVAAARNRGIDLAKGELIAFLDQDDLFLPHKLAAQVACLEAHPEAGMVHSGWQRINDCGEMLGTVEPWHKAPRLDLSAWLWWKPVLLSAMMFRKYWLEKVEGLDPQFRQVCDLDLAWRLTLMGCETVWLPQITVCYREHDRNDSLNTQVQAQESQAILDKFFSLQQISPNLRRLETECRYYTLVWSAWRLYHTGYLTEMAEYLEKSLVYTHKYRTETVMNWIECFNNYASECGSEIDIYSLCNSPQWKQLIGKSVF